MWLLLPFALTLIILKHVLILTQGCKLTMITLFSAGHGWAFRSCWSSWAEGGYCKINISFLLSY